MPAAADGPLERGGCADGRDHALRSRLELMREVQVCLRCGGAWARPIREVDKVRGELRSVQGRPFSILRPGSRSSRSPSLGRDLRRAGVLDTEGRVPNFEELERRRREAARRDELAELIRRRGRR